ncbi:dUTP diphosphatase [Candidatus Woesearchaeota archaeon]|nr:dUTP diphosphatase [Candidatus Woesearchaeota archaeon]
MDSSLTENSSAENASSPAPPVLQVRICKVDKDLPTPHYARKGDAGMDLYAAESTVLQPGEFKLVSTGIKVAVPEGYEMHVRARSGLAAKHGIGLMNGIGTIDSGYRGIVGVILFNFGKAPLDIQRGDRIAQAVFNKIETAQLHDVSELDATDRGEGGFGHTGMT